MIDKDKFQLFKELFERSSSILIMCPNGVSRDQILASTSFYMSLKKNTNKRVRLLFPTDFSKDKKNNDIIFTQDVQTKIGSDNLCISLDYVEDSIDKINYHINEELKKFYLTIKPKKGFAPLSKENIDFSYTGVEADMIILIGVNELETLGGLYYGYENLYKNTALVSINSYETDFGNLKIDASGISSFSELIAQILVNLQISITQDSATNLLLGISEQTDYFKSYMATADTFEIISKLLREGAKRTKPKKIIALENTDLNKSKKISVLKTSKLKKSAKSAKLKLPLTKVSSKKVNKKNDDKTLFSLKKKN